MTKYLRKDAEYSKSINNDPMKRNLVLLKILIQCGCMWPETDNKILIIIGWINVASMASLNLCQICDLVINREYISIVEMGFIAGSLPATIKLVVLVMYRKKLRTIIGKIWSEFLPIKAATESVQIKLKNLATFNLRVICTFILLICVSLFQFFYSELFNGSRNLPFRLYFLPKFSPLYETFFVWQISALVFAGIIGSSVDLLFVTLVQIFVTQFQIINSGLKLVGSVDDDNKRKFIEYFTCNGQEVSKKLLHQYLVNKYVGQHNMLTMTCLELAKVFQYIVLIQLLTAAISICFSSFAMKLYPEQILQCCVVPIVAFLQLGFYCWFSEQLTCHAENSAAAAYGCAWYNISDLQLRKSLILIIQRANDEIAMTAGGFTNIRLNTFVQVSKFCVSVYTLLKKITDKTNLQSG